MDPKNNIIEFRDNGFENKDYRRKAARLKARVIGIVIVVIAFFYVPSLFYWAYSVNVSTDMVKFGTLEDSINLDAVLVRNEFVLKPDVSGRFFSEINDGERVQAYSQIATVLSSAKEDLLVEMSKIDQSLLEYQNNASKHKLLVSTGIEKIDDELAKKAKEIISAENSNCIYKINGVRADMDFLMKKKVQAIASATSDDAGFNKLLDARRAILAQIVQNTAEIKTQAAGMVSYMVDGYESKFNSANVRQLKPSDLKDIKNNSTFMMPIDSKIEAGKPFAKIVVDNEYYVVFVVSKERSRQFKEGDEIKLRIIQVDTTIKGVVDYLSEVVESKAVIAVKVDRALSETVGLRKISVDILKNTYNGFKVPLSALSDFDAANKKAKILAIKGGLTKFIDVKVVGSNEEFAVIDNASMQFSNGLNLYDLIVINNKNVKEGQFVN